VADRQGTAPKAGIIALFDRRIESVHVDMDDLANPGLAHGRSLADLEPKANIGH